MVESIRSFGVVDTVRALDSMHWHEGDLRINKEPSRVSSSGRTVDDGFLPSSVKVAEANEIGIKDFDS